MQYEHEVIRGCSLCIQKSSAGDARTVRWTACSFPGNEESQCITLMLMHPPHAAAPLCPATMSLLQTLACLDLLHFFSRDIPKNTFVKNLPYDCKQFQKPSCRLFVTTVCPELCIPHSKITCAAQRIVLRQLI